MKSVPQVGSTPKTVELKAVGTARALEPRSNVLPFDARLKARLFGSPELEFNAEDIGSRLGAKPRALIFLLLLAESHRMPRSVLASLLWAEQGDGGSRANLRLSLSRLRQQLPDLVQADKEYVWIKPADIARVDALQVESTARQIGTAPVNKIRYSLEDCRGEFLEGFAVRGAPEFDEWLRQKREYYGAQLMALVRAALDRLDPRSEQDHVLWFSQRWVQLDDTDEAANRQLMLAYQAMGRRTHAIRHYEQYRKVLADRLGARPSAAIYELYRQIHSDAPQQQPLLSLPDEQASDSTDEVALSTLITMSGAGELPRINNAIVGREELLVEIVHRFNNPECRLLTLLGPGGIGKSRLAIEFAQSLPEPVIFVSLTGVAPLSDADEATDTLTALLANSLGITFKSPEPSQRVLLRQLEDRVGLILLDGFEVLKPAAPLLDEILQAAPGIRILVTSRERLSSTSQWLLDVPGLSIKTTDSLRQGERESDALALFEAVARRVNPDFRPVENRRAVERILHIVQGSPLGIELAANWVRMLSCEDIVTRLETGLDLLTRDKVDGDDRHSSMNAVLESSWNLLDEDMQTGLARLSVFSGSFDATAAEPVCGLRTRDLANLVDRSWLTAIQVPKGARFLMHDLVRHYASDKLAADPEAFESASEQHAGYFKQYVEQSWPDAEVINLATVRRFNPGRQNLDQAWHWLRERRDAATLHDFVEACHHYYVHKGWMRAAVTLIEQALQLPGLSKEIEIHWENKLAQDQWHSSRQGRSKYRAERVLQLVGEPVPRGGVGTTLAVAGSLARHLRGLVLKPRVSEGAPWNEDLVQALTRLSAIGYLTADSPARLIHYALRCDELSARHGVPAGTVWSNAYLSILANGLGWHRVSRLYSERALEALPALGQGPLDSNAYLNLGIDRFVAGQWDISVDQLERSAACYATTGQWRISMDAAAIKGMLHISRRQHEAGHECWSLLRREGKEYGDRLVELWGFIGAAETDLICGVKPDTRALASAAQFLPAGTRHEQCRFDAATAGAALIEEDYELASHHAHKALITMKAGRFLPFYDSEATYNCCNVLLLLADRSPLQQTVRTSAGEAARLAYRLARQNPFFMPRASLLMARAMRQAGQNGKAIKLAARSRMTAHALGLPIEAAEASRFKV